jgi:hypothetical protein
MITYAEAAGKIADEWGPAITKVFKQNDASALKALCEPVVEVVVQGNSGSDGSDAGGGTASFTCGDGGSVSWEDFVELAVKDLSDQDYAYTESASLGILGNRMVLETARINQSEEMYTNNCSVLTLSKNGKVSVMESFADLAATSFVVAGLAAEAAK